MKQSKHITVPVSVGDFIDRMTILALKLENIEDPGKLNNVRREYELLLPLLEELEVSVESRDFKQLMTVNRTLWNIEDAIRGKEKNKEFDKAFIALARETYICNDHRAALKRKINVKHNSDLLEEKEYTVYLAS